MISHVRVCRPSSQNSSAKPCCEEHPQASAVSNQVLNNHMDRVVVLQLLVLAAPGIGFSARSVDQNSAPLILL